MTEKLLPCRRDPLLHFHNVSNIAPSWSGVAKLQEKLA